jgi:hypothetical protein
MVLSADLHSFEDAVAPATVVQVTHVVPYVFGVDDETGL